MTIETRRKWVQAIGIAGIVLTIVGGFWIGKTNLFKPGGNFQQLIEQLGLSGRVLFVGLMAANTTLPVIPLGLLNVLGVLVFGFPVGVTLNIIGTLLGTVTNFLLGRKFGEDFVLSFISDAQYAKYLGLLDQGKRFERILFAGLLLPFFPDDIFCMIAGLTKMSFERFLAIISFCRPISVFIYSFVSTNAIQFSWQWLSQLWTK